MEQEKFGNFIKEIRKKNNLTQKELADKLGVTYQAVSKWENGKNMPDKALIKQIAKELDVSIEEIFDGEYHSNNKNKPYILIGIILLILLIIVIAIVVNNRDNDFKFRTIGTSCDNFQISGSLSYNHNKSAIYISSIEYCGQEEDKTYAEIECILYEKNDNVEKQISSYKSDNITLKEFLSEVKFLVDDYEQSCREYSENSLYLLINAKDNSEKTTSYKIPLILEKNCLNIK